MRENGAGFDSLCFCHLVWILKECNFKYKERKLAAVRVYIPKRRRIMQTHRVETGSTKPNTSGISHLNVEPIADPRTFFRVGTDGVKYRNRGI